MSDSNVDYALKGELMDALVDELIGSALDYAVAQALGMPILVSKYYARYDIYVHPDMPDNLGRIYRPSESWEDAGVLMNRFKPSLLNMGKYFLGRMENEGSIIEAKGSRYCEAICRTVVKSLQGETVKIPKSVLSCMHNE